MPNETENGDAGHRGLIGVPEIDALQPDNLPARKIQIRIGS